MTEEAIRAKARVFLKTEGAKFNKSPVDTYPDILKTIGAEILPLEVPSRKHLNISGVLLKGDNDNCPYIIGINYNKPDTHIRFTVAHEIGHIILNHLNRVEILFETASNFNLNNNKYNLLQRLEWEANVFAAEVLVPTNKLKQLIVKNLPPWQLAENFWVSQEVIFYRLLTINAHDYLKEYSEWAQKIQNKKTS